MSETIEAPSIRGSIANATFATSLISEHVSMLGDSGTRVTGSGATERPWPVIPDPRAITLCDGTRICFGGRFVDAV